MQPRPRNGVGRADLLRALHERSGAAETAQVATLLGYVGALVEAERSGTDPTSSELPELLEPLARAASPEGPLATTTQRAESRAESDARRVQFLRTVRADRRVPLVAGARDDLQEVTRRDIAAPAGRVAPAAPMLQPWRRLRPYLREVLGQMVTGAQLDVRRAVVELARLRPVHRLPRRRWRAWAEQAVVIVDCDPALVPFRADAKALLARLKTERGVFGLRERWWRALPAGAVDELPRRAPVLVLGDLGQAWGEGGGGEAWGAFGRELRRRGHPLAALVPCPPDRWSRGQAAVWPSAVWDRGRALPRSRSGQQPRPAPEADARRSEGVRRLLALVSAAVRIEPEMLRALRWLLPAELADVGAEYEAWNHPHLARTELAAGFLPDTAPEHRARLAGLERELVAKATALLIAWHELFSPAYGDDLVQRLAQAGAEISQERLREARANFRRIVDTLELELRGGAEVKSGELGLMRFVENQLGRLAPAERGQSEVSRAYALATLLGGRSGGERPEGIDAKVVEAVCNAHIAAASVEQSWALRQEGEALTWRRSGEGGVARTGVPVAGIATQRNRFEVKIAGPAGGERTRELVPPAEDEWRVGLTGAARIGVVGDIAGVEMVREGRPSWASRMGYDRHGLYAEIELAEDVPLRLRWVPPGRFFMGSPEAEVGRYSDEGPRHEVTISSGFWLGETPVTQRQWRAVMPDNPSRFAQSPDSAERPVERVTWQDARAFCAAVAERFPELVFDLPSEAEWEYAGRAGTESAFNDGSALEADAGKSAALDRLGWYGANSGSATHPVGEKPANAWGLRDVHGNMWEWCLDGLRGYAARAETDPLGPLERDHRVIRSGSWDYQPRYCRSAYRRRLVPGGRLDNLGFRLAAGQEIERREAGDGAHGLAAEAERDAEPKGQPVRSVAAGVRRPRPWAQRFARDEFGVRLEFRLREALFTLRWIPAGRFMMGSPKDEPGRWDDEGPQHEVEITRGFWLGATPVTQAQWAAVMDKNPSHFKGAERPVENVSWEECVAYGGRVNELLPGFGARLPSEAEWEYACRAGATTAFSDGSACTVPEGADPALDALAWYAANSGRETHPVGLKAANAFGLFDVHGNVWEWCHDFWGNYTPRKQTDPAGPEAGDLRVFRGGCWANQPRGCRSAFRDGLASGDPFGFLGFRLAAGQELRSAKAELSAESSELRAPTEWVGSGGGGWR